VTNAHGELLYAHQQDLYAVTSTVSDVVVAGLAQGDGAAAAEMWTAAMTVNEFEQLMRAVLVFIPVFDVVASHWLLLVLEPANMKISEYNGTKTNVGDHGPSLAWRMFIEFRLDRLERLKPEHLQQPNHIRRPWFACHSKRYNLCANRESGVVIMLWCEMLARRGTNECRRAIGRATVRQRPFIAFELGFRLILDRAAGVPLPHNGDELASFGLPICGPSAPWPLQEPEFRLHGEQVVGADETVSDAESESGEREEEEEGGQAAARQSQPREPGPWPQSKYKGKQLFVVWCR